MTRRISLEPHLSIDELEHSYRAAKEPNERTWWWILWLLPKGRTATELSAVIGYRAYWIGQIAKRYNKQGPDGMRNRRHITSYRPAPILSAEQQEELRVAISQAGAQNQHWAGTDGAGFGHPTAGRTVCHLATSVFIALFEAELAAIARAAGASSGKQLVLVLDRAALRDPIR